MPSTYKVLGQVCPANTNDTTLYTCPSSTQTVVSTIVVANITATNRVFRIAIRPNGATIANEHYVAYDVVCAANDSVTLTLGITIDASAVITVRSSFASALTFNAFGVELT